MVFPSGFMVMGFDKATNAVIGTFNIPPTDQYSKTLNCDQYDVNFIPRLKSTKYDLCTILMQIFKIM